MSQSFIECLYTYWFKPHVDYIQSTYGWNTFAKLHHTIQQLLFQIYILFSANLRNYYQGCGIIVHVHTKLSVVQCTSNSFDHHSLVHRISLSKCIHSFEFSGQQKSKQRELKIYVCDKVTTDKGHLHVIHTYIYV